MNKHIANNMKSSFPYTLPIAQPVVLRSGSGFPSFVFHQRLAIQSFLCDGLLAHSQKHFIKILILELTSNRTKVQCDTRKKKKKINLSVFLQQILSNRVE